MKISILCTAFIVSLSLQGQVNIDSIKQVLNTTEPSKEHLNDYLDAMMKYDPNDIEATQMIGNWVQKNAQFKNLKEIEANAYLNLGHAYLIASNYEVGMKNLIAGNRISEDQQLYETQAKIQNAMGRIYYANKQISKAIACYQESLDLFKKTNSDKGIATANYNLAGMYLETGWQDPDTLNMGVKLIKESIDIAKKIKDTTNIIIFSSGIIQSYLDLEDYDSGLKTLNEIEQLIMAFGKDNLYVDYYLRLGQFYDYTGDYIKSIESYQKGLQISKKLKMPRKVYNYYSGLAYVYENMENYKEANKYNVLYSKVRDSLINQENYKVTADLQNRYENEKKQKEILNLKSTNEKKANLNNILIGSSIALLLLGFLGYRNFRHNRNLQNLKISELEKDKQLLTIDAMLKGQEEERSRIAKDLHDGLGGLLSGTKLSFIHMKENLILTPENAAQFDNSLGMLDNTIADLRKVAQNLMPEALVKFGLEEALRDFCNSIQSSSKITVDYQKLGIDRKLASTAEVFIYRIVQELVNNAIKHAKASEIIVQLSLSENKASLTVEDNGIGYDKNSIQNKKGSGLDNIEYRVSYLNGTIDTNTSPNNGTSVNIELNV